MPELRLNLTEAESLKPVADGTYPGEIVGFGQVTQGPKAKYIGAIIKISEGEHEGRKFYLNLPVEGKGAGIMVDFINKATGSTFDVDDHDALDVDTDDLIGCPVGMVIKQEEYPEGSGDFRSQIKRILAAEAPAPKKGKK
jgi:hypothetical protein